MGGPSGTRGVVSEPRVLVDEITNRLNALPGACTVRESEDDEGDPEEVDLAASYSTFDDFNLITRQSRELQPVEFLFESMKHIVIDFACTPQVMQL